MGELIMAACTGTFKLTQSENFEEFMKVLGVGLVTRKLGNKSSPTVTITEEAGEFTFKQESLVKTSEIKFKLGQEFDELTADGCSEAGHRLRYEEQAEDRETPEGTSLPVKVGRNMEELFKGLGRRVGDDWKCCYQVEEQHDLHHHPLHPLDMASTMLSFTWSPREK